MRPLLIFAFAGPFVALSVHAGVIRGILLNDDDPYFIKGDDGSLYKAEWYWGSNLFYEGDQVILTQSYGQAKMINEDQDEVADVLVEEISSGDSIARPMIVTPKPSVSAFTPTQTPILPTTPAPSATASTQGPTAIGATWPDGKKLLHPDQSVRTHVVNVAANDTLKLRSGPGTSFRIIAEIPSDEVNIIAFNQDQIWDGDSWWCPVEWNGFRGYISRSYLPK
jgi:Bacterial SH3 domain